MQLLSDFPHQMGWVEKGMQSSGQKEPQEQCIHRNKKCIEVATVEFLKGKLVLLLEIEWPLSISHVFSKQSVFYFIKLSALFFSPLMLYFIFNPSLLFLPVFAGEISLCHVFLFLTVFWPLHSEQCCTFFTIHISISASQTGFCNFPLPKK